ncbi:MAG: mercury methylation corrinoid protein HgcA [Bacteroidia bacterium]|nr:mercury methylation corrinoid protein HgcA [Bacteroidia bacterium]
MNFAGQVSTPPGEVNLVTSGLRIADYLGALKVRWAFGRNNYRVAPGLYGHGSPGRNSPVMVTANYKLSFDHLRKNLSGIDCWILVLDTKGINVWCAAGKGTFGTNELVSKISETGLSDIVAHRYLLVPQLGATGVAAHEVKKQSGFRVIFGPVRASDIPEFINNQYKATTAMRTVRFNLKDRMILIPAEIMEHFSYLVFVMAAIFLLGGLNRHGYSLDAALDGGLAASFKIAIAYLTGCVITPVVFPLLPVRHFFLKGAITGFLIAVAVFILYPSKNIFETIAWFLLVPAVSSFISMNFTGTSTFTSLSGVLKEMKTAIPLQISIASAGLLLWIIARFIS